MSASKSQSRKRRVGTVVSDKMNKSIIVAFSWTSRHPVYGKARKRVTKFQAHDEENRASLGDVVLIEETRPISRNKRWRLVDIIQAGDVAEFQPSEVDPEPGAEARGEEEE